MIRPNLVDKKSTYMCIFLSFYAQIVEEFIRPIVHNKTLREVSLFKERVETFVIGNLKRDMRIAAENRWNVVLLA